MSRASNLAGFTTAVGPPTDLNVGVITATNINVADNFGFTNITATDSITVGLTTIKSSGINSPLGVSTLGQVEIAGITTINSDGIQSTGIGTFNKVAIGTDSPSRQTYLTLGGITQPTTFPRGGLAVKALSDGVNRDSNIYLEEKTGGEGWYIGVNTEGSLNFYNSDNLTPTVFLQDSNNNVGLGSTVPTVSVDISEKTDAVALPVGTTAQRPSTAYGGYIRWNSTSSALEVYNGTNWVEIISDYFPSGSTILG